MNINTETGSEKQHHMSTKLTEMMTTLMEGDNQKAFSLGKNLQKDESISAKDMILVNYVLCVAGRQLGLYEESITHGEIIKDTHFVLKREEVAQLWLALTFSSFMLHKQTGNPEYLKSANMHASIAKHYETKATKAEIADLMERMSHNDHPNNTNKSQKKTNKERVSKILMLTAKVLVILVLLAGIVGFVMELRR